MDGQLYVMPKQESTALLFCLPDGSWVRSDKVVAVRPWRVPNFDRSMPDRGRDTKYFTRVDIEGSDPVLIRQSSEEEMMTLVDKIARSVAQTFDIRPAKRS